MAELKSIYQTISQAKVSGKDQNAKRDQRAIVSL